MSLLFSLKEPQITVLSVSSFVGSRFKDDFQSVLRTLESLFTTFVLFHVTLSLKLPDECGPCTIRNSSLAIKRWLLVKPELLWSYSWCSSIDWVERSANVLLKKEFVLKLIHKFGHVFKVNSLCCGRCYVKNVYHYVPLSLNFTLIQRKISKIISKCFWQVLKGQKKSNFSWTSPYFRACCPLKKEIPISKKL